jgi:hypothetical protein
MSPFVSVNPEALGAAAQDLTGIESAITSINSSAATSTTQIAVAAEDEVSAAIASVFSSHGNAFQAVSAQAAEFHSQFVNVLEGAAGAYLRTEVANASTLTTRAQSVLSHQPGTAGSAATGDATMGPGTYGPGVYADGRVHVEPGCKIIIGAGSYLSAAPGSEVWLFAEPKGSVIDLNYGADVSVGSKSALILGGAAISSVNGLNTPLSLGPYAILTMGNDSKLDTGGGLILDHTELNIRPLANFGNDSQTAPVIISNGTLVSGSYRTSVPFTNWDRLIGAYYDPIKIRKFP